MEEERIELSARERGRLKVLYAIEQGHLRQIDAARRRWGNWGVLRGDFSMGLGSTTSI